MSGRRTGAWVFVLGVLGVLVALGIMYKLSGVPDPAAEEPGDAEAGREAPPGPREDVVFIVTDMIRSDRLSACGYGRPTSPILAGLAALDGVAFTCEARSPGTWTLPSHASFFTGEEVPIHGADCLANPEGKESVSLWGDVVRPLGKSLPTLAERMAKEGYRTVLVSGNPVVSRRAATGLDRGFEVVRESERFGDAYGRVLVAMLEEALGEAGSSEPVFLFVNVADAHHPWLAVPPGLGWIPPRPFLDNRPRLADNPYPRFFRGQMPPDEREAFLAHASDSYDYAVRRSDETLGWVMDVLKRRGLAGEEDRLVVTSDHGEFLGEHDLLSHGIFVYEPDTRVPLLFKPSRSDATASPSPPGGRPGWGLKPSRSDATASPLTPGPSPAERRRGESEPVSALTAYDLSLDGRFPEKPRPVRAAGYPDGLMSRLFGDRLAATTAAHWNGAEKLFYSNGEYSIFDLEADPGELSPAPLPPDHPMRPSFERFVEQVLETGGRAAEPSPEMMDALRELGYVR